MIKKFIFPVRFFLNSDFYEKFVYGKLDKYLSTSTMVAKYLKYEHIKLFSIKQGNPFCFYVEIYVSDNNSIKLIKDKGLIPVGKSPYETQSDFDYTANKYYKEIVKDLVKNSLNIHLINRQEENK